jgi:hypothetical protein
MRLSHVVALYSFVAVAAAVATFFFLQGGSEDPVNGASPRIAASGVTVEPGEAGRSAGEQAGRTVGAAAETAPSDCGFFDHLRGSEGSLESVLELLQAVQPIGSNHLACLPVDWVLLILVHHCAGGIELSPIEQRALSQHIESGWLQPLQSRSSIQTGSPLMLLDPEQVPCVVDLLLDPDAPDEEFARLWARVVVVALAGKGSIFGADESAVAALRSYMLNWPIREDWWWDVMWAEMGGETRSTRALAVRLGVMEALHGLLSEDEWLARVDHLVSLGTDRDSLEAMTQAGLGMLLRRNLSAHRVALLLGENVSDALRCAVILEFPTQLRWPEQGNEEIPSEIVAAIKGLRDSDAFPHRFELLKHQWRILGPVEAGADLQRFSENMSTPDSGWSTDAAVRVHAALRAFAMEEAAHGNDRVAIDNAKSIVRDWLLSMPADDQRRVAFRLKTSFWDFAPEQTPQLQALLREVLGGQGMDSIPANVRGMLVGE